MNRASAIDTLYENPLASQDDLAGWRFEGEGATSFPLGRLRLEGTRDPEEGQKSNLVCWCPEEFPDHIRVSWDFRPLHEPGLCILFFAARGRGGEDLFDDSLAPRSGPYDQYHSGDIDALHVSYFRRMALQERRFATCNLRKSHGFHLVAQGADPIPPLPDALGPYRVVVTKRGPDVDFGIGHRDGPVLTLFSWHDDGTTYGPVLGGGKIGFRQMTPMIAEYSDLLVERLPDAD